MAGSQWLCAITAPPSSRPDEVAALCARLGLEPDKPLCIRAAGQGGAVPSHLPAAATTAAAVLARCVDINVVTKKAMLKALAAYAADAAEGAELTRLAAREGRADFNTGPSPPGRLSACRGLR